MIKIRRRVVRELPMPLLLLVVVFSESTRIFVAQDEGLAERENNEAARTDIEAISFALDTTGSVLF